MEVKLKLKSSDIDKLVKQLCVIVDTREQNDKVIKVLEKRKVPYVVRKLDFGDYSAELKACPELGLPYDISLENIVAIERKGSGGSGLTEIAHNFGEGRTAFENEFIRAKEAGVTMYLIIENGSYADILEHKYDSQFNEKALYNSLLSWRRKFGFHIDFVKSEYVGDHILKILGITLKKILEK